MQSLSSILTHREKKYFLTDLKSLPIKLTEVENKIIEKRLIGLSFCQLEENDVRVATDKILLKGAAICGCKLPQTEGFAEVISDEIVVFILEHGFSELTEEEIFLSLRLNARGELKFPTGIEIEPVQFSGNSLNIDYLSKVFSNYMKLRNILDRKFQNHLDGH